MRSILPLAARLGLLLAVVAACDDASTPGPIAPTPAGPQAVAAAPSRARAPRPAPTPAPTERAAEVAVAAAPAPEPAPAAAPALATSAGPGPLAPPRPIDQDPRCAEAARLFAAGEQAMAAGDLASGRNHYLELVKNYPVCPEVPHVYLAFGEHYFAAGRLDEARRFYRKVTEFRDQALMAFAVYKLAWCDLKAGDPGSALVRFAEAFTIAGRDPRSQGALQKAVLDDSAIAFAAAGDPAKAAAFYLRLAGEAGARAAIDNLAGIYRARREYERASVVCEALPGACR